jgi:hypothetical protein
LVKTVISCLPQKGNRSCIYWTGTSNIRDMVGELVRLLYFAADLRLLYPRR